MTHLSKTKYDPIKYKIGSRDNWNSVAAEYHYNWADKGIGPFASTAEVVKLAEIKQDHRVLDLGCGTGVVSKQIHNYLSSKGLLIGIDLSYGPLSIARKSICHPNAEFCEMDAENISIDLAFDRVVCQYALMFFPNALDVLKKVKGLMKKGGKIIIAVHGEADGVPYFSTIMQPILLHIPNIRPRDAPTVHRFGSPKKLDNILKESGFTEISIKKFIFRYDAGEFDQYWRDYLSSTANSIRPAIEAAGNEVVSKIRKKAEENAARYIQHGKIRFPWDVIIATGTA